MKKPTTLSPSKALPASLLVLAPVIAFCVLLLPSPGSAADWFQVSSNDKKVSVMFPHKAETFEVVTSDSPAGSVKTEVVKHQEDGILLTISDSKLPGLAVAFAGDDTILKNGAAGVINKALGKEISSEKTTISGASALVLKYAAADFQKAGHPGYSGLAVLFVVKGHLYVINSVITKENPQTKATQQRLLDSIKVSG